MYFLFLWRFDPIPSYGLPLRDFAITLIGHITLNRALEDWWTGSRNLYLTTRNAHKRQIFLPQTGFEPRTPARERPHTHACNFFQLRFYLRVFIPFTNNWIELYFIPILKRVLVFRYIKSLSKWNTRAVTSSDLTLNWRGLGRRLKLVTGSLSDSEQR